MSTFRDEPTESTDNTSISVPAAGWVRFAVGTIGGLASGLAGLGAAEVVAGTSLRLRSPVLDVGERVIDRVPAWLKD